MALPEEQVVQVEPAEFRNRIGAGLGPWGQLGLQHPRRSPQQPIGLARARPRLRGRRRPLFKLQFRFRLLDSVRGRGGGGRQQPANFAPLPGEQFLPELLRGAVRIALAHGGFRGRSGGLSREVLVFLKSRAAQHGKGGVFTPPRQPLEESHSGILLPARRLPRGDAIIGARSLGVGGGLGPLARFQDVQVAASQPLPVFARHQRHRQDRAKPAEDLPVGPGGFRQPGALVLVGRLQGAKRLLDGFLGFQPRRQRPCLAGCTFPLIGEFRIQLPPQFLSGLDAAH